MQETSKTGTGGGERQARRDGVIDESFRTLCPWYLFWMVLSGMIHSYTPPYVNNHIAEACCGTNCCSACLTTCTPTVQSPQTTQGRVSMTHPSATLLVGVLQSTKPPFAVWRLVIGIFCLVCIFVAITARAVGARVDDMLTKLWRASRRAYHTFSNDLQKIQPLRTQSTV